MREAKQGIGMFLKDMRKSSARIEALKNSL